MNIKNIIGLTIIASSVYSPKTVGEVIKANLSDSHSLPASISEIQEDVKVDVVVILNDLERVVTFTIPEKNIDTSNEAIRCKETPDGGRTYEVNNTLYNQRTSEFEKGTINLEGYKESKRTYASTDGTTQKCEEYDDVCVVNTNELKKRINSLLELPLCKK